MTTKVKGGEQDTVVNFKYKYIFGILLENNFILILRLIHWAKFLQHIEIYLFLNEYIKYESITNILV